MPGSGRLRSLRPFKAAKDYVSQRDRLAVLVALATAACLILSLLVANDTRFLMPGPLTSAHGALKNCSACHTKSGSGKMSWIHGLFEGDARADSKACVTCHKMPETAFNAHSASAGVLTQSTTRLSKIAETMSSSPSMRIQSTVFPAKSLMADGVVCATCHQEHKGANFDLSKISNEQCRSCHMLKFDSFDGHHPEFDKYPFARRTRIIYDHAGHFGKHYPELAKKDPSKHIPTNCSACHNSRDDKRVMAVAPFDETCGGCHLDQITGKARATGPKGIAFLTVPGLDVQTLKKKNAAIGEWPENSDAELTPFMKVMISSNDGGRALIKAVEGLNLQDLTAASDDQIKAVTNLVWKIKALYFALNSGKASDVLAELKITTETKLNANLIADLTASIPRDVVNSAHRQWLPNLAIEMEKHRNGGEASPGEWVVTEPKTTNEGAKPDSARIEDASGKTGGEGKASDEASPASTAPDAKKTKASNAGAIDPRADHSNPQACVASIFGQCLMFKDQDAPTSKPENGTEGAIKLPEAMRAGLQDFISSADKAAARRETANGKRERLAADDSGIAGEGPITARQSLPSGTTRAIEERRNGTGKSSQPRPAPVKIPDAANSGPADLTPATAKETPRTEPVPGNASEQSDDLLHPSADELRQVQALSKEWEKPDQAAAKPEVGNGHSEQAIDAGSKSDAVAAGLPPASPAPADSINTDVDPESWAEYGGWYRQDYAIYYRPTGHKDKFIYSWLFLTGRDAPKNDTGPAAAVFDSLTGKDAQGACTKCHSVDDIPGNGRIVNFSPASNESKQGGFTTFIHEPHFGIMEKRGCLTCHTLGKGPAYLKSYEQGDPKNFVADFSNVKRDLCQSCHNQKMARQDCLTCHKYHVNDVTSPITQTKIPMR